MIKKHEMIATVLGIGHLPVISGTWGSLAGLVPCLLLHDRPLLYFTVFAALFAFGGISAAAVEKEDGVKDPTYVVIDEFASIFLVFAFVPVRAAYVITGVILYRVFDIVKPPPIRLLENKGGGWGIMFDDAMAAVYANLILQGMKLLGV